MFVHSSHNTRNNDYNVFKNHDQSCCRDYKSILLHNLSQHVYDNTTKISNHTQPHNIHTTRDCKQSCYYIRSLDEQKKTWEQRQNNTLDCIGWCMMMRHQPVIVLFCCHVSGWLRAVSGISITLRQIIEYTGGCKLREWSGASNGL